jgi:hypothetical protein
MATRSRSGGRNALQIAEADAHAAVEKSSAASVLIPPDGALNTTWPSET